MNRPVHKGHAEHGFSLLETLVALGILAVSLGATFNVISTALLSAAEADALARATRAGESVLGLLGADIPLTEGVSNGAVNDHLSWRMTVTPFRTGEEFLSWQMPLRGYWVEVEVGWEEAGRVRSVRLATLRLASLQEGAS
ncbi:MAG: prepilin-type N-terminal cleavage/methylation domain-containing protein [Haliea sp.]